MGLKKSSTMSFITIITSKDGLLVPKNMFTDREYSPFYNSFFSVMSVDRPSILFVSCTMISIECNNSEIILKSDFQILKK